LPHKLGGGGLGYINWDKHPAIKQTNVFRRRNLSKSPQFAGDSLSYGSIVNQSPSNLWDKTCGHLVATSIIFIT